MAGGFSLGGGHQNQQYPPNEIPPETLFLYRNEEISFYNNNNNKGLQLWHQQQQQHLNRHIHHNPEVEQIYSSALGRAEVPDHHHDLGSSSVVPIMMKSQGGGFCCQDCGNQAKKDCAHMRCRACCKSRGFQCQTHVKSTWVPASKRRERKQQQQQQQQEQQLRAESTKRPRENLAAAAPLACTTTRLLTATSSGLEVGNFPAEVNTAAVFRCVRVSSIDDSEDQYAYRTAVNIGGRVFKGILYDQGPETHHQYGESSSGGSGDHGGPRNNLITTAANNNTSTTTTASAAAAALLLDPSSNYPTSLNDFVAVLTPIELNEEKQRSMRNRLACGSALLLNISL